MSVLKQNFLKFLSLKNECWYVFIQGGFDTKF